MTDRAHAHIGWPEELTLIDKIEDLMISDEEDREKQDHYLMLAYGRHGEVGKTAIDEALIAICGYSLKTLIEQKESGTIEV